jgi:hypothetical protein
MTACRRHRRDVELLAQGFVGDVAFEQAGRLQPFEMALRSQAHPEQALPRRDTAGRRTERLQRPPRAPAPRRYCHRVPLPCLPASRPILAGVARASPLLRHPADHVAVEALSWHCHESARY